MEEIKVGEYVRTEKGLIDKVIGFIQDEILFEKDSMLQYKSFNDITNHSFNIIDLVQYGDYGIMSYRGMIIKKIIGKDDLVELQLKNYKLLKIATKEQMEDILYKVGE